MVLGRRADRQFPAHALTPVSSPNGAVAPGSPENRCRAHPSQRSGGPAPPSIHGRPPRHQVGRFTMPPKSKSPPSPRPLSCASRVFGECFWGFSIKTITRLAGSEMGGDLEHATRSGEARRPCPMTQSDPPSARPGLAAHCWRRPHSRPSQGRRERFSYSPYPTPQRSEANNRVIVARARNKRRGWAGNGWNSKCR